MLLLKGAEYQWRCCAFALQRLQQFLLSLSEFNWFSLIFPLATGLSIPVGACVLLSETAVPLCSPAMDTPGLTAWTAIGSLQMRTCAWRLLQRNINTCIKVARRWQKGEWSYSVFLGIKEIQGTLFPESLHKESHGSLYCLSLFVQMAGESADTCSMRCSI